MAQRETEPIGQLLLEHGWISGPQLAGALDRQRELGGRLGTALLEMGALPESGLLKALTEQTGLPLANIDDLRRIPQEVIDLLPAKAAIRHGVVPVRISPGRIELAVLSEPDIPTLDELAFVVGRRVVIHIANEARIYEALEHYYGEECPLRFKHLLDRLNHLRDNLGMETAPRSRVNHAPEQPAPAATEAAPTTQQPEPVATEAAPTTQQTAPAAVLKPLKPRLTSVPLSADEKKSLSRLDGRATVKPLSQDGIQKALQAAHRADDIGAALLGFLGQEFLRLLLFRVGQGRVRGWLARSPALDEYGFRNWTVGFDEASVFLNLRQGAEFFLGRLPAMPAHERLVKCWRGSLDTECAVFPVKVRDRLVCAIYGDRDSLGLAGLDVPAVQRITAKAAIAFEMLLMQRKLRS